MKIRIRNNTFVDFAAPVYMTERKFSEFMQLMNTIFPGYVEIKQVSEPERFREVREHEKTRKWTPEDYLVLLEVPSNQIAAEKLGRSEMAIRMKRGEFVPAFNNWAHKQNRTVSKHTVKEYLDQNNE